jgi:hypothetical protein
MRRISFPASILLLCLLVATTSADVRYEPVKVRLQGVTGAGTPNDPLRAQLRFETIAPGEIENLRLEGTGWQLELQGPPRSLVPGVAASTPLVAVGSDPESPLVVRFEFDGLPIEKTFDLSPRSLALLREPGATTRPSAAGTFRAGLRTTPPDVAPSAVLGGPAKRDRVMNDADDPPRAQARNIRVHGRFVYVRSDGTTIGADGVACRIYDEDTGPDELLATTASNVQGYYDVTFYWDPCFACDGEPDIYVHFEAANSRVEVESATLEINYTWTSYQTDDYTGTDLDIGTLQPTDAAQHPALHILTDATRTWRWFNDLHGLDTPTTDVQWPDGTTGAWYNSFYQEIHISSEHEWQEPTHSHEYGHHWQQNFATLSAPNYCNGICDTSPSDCGHCLFCRETASDALDEGWGDWIADVLTRSFGPTYGIASQFFYPVESVQNCQVDGTLHDPTITEGFCAAVMRDIEDTGQDDDPLIPGAWMDRLAEGSDEIVTTMDQDAPTTATGFLAAFKARYPGLCPLLWETAKNNGYEIDAQAPGVVGNLVSPSHGAPSADPTVDLAWTRAPDDCSGTAVYSGVVAATAQLPDQTPELADVTSATTAPLAPGTWFFSIRARDRAGNWSPNYASVAFTVTEPPVPVAAQVERTAAFPDRVELVWAVDRSAVRAVAIERRAEAEPWSRIAATAPDAGGRVRWVDAGVSSGRRYGYRLALTVADGEVLFGEVWLETPLASVLALGAPEVSTSAMALRFTLPSAAPAKLTVVDVAGRRVASRAVGALGPGTHRLELDETRRIAAGIYLVTLEQAGARATRRAVIVR